MTDREQAIRAAALKEAAEKLLAMSTSVPSTEFTGAECDLWQKALSEAAAILALATAPPGYVVVKRDELEKLYGDQLWGAYNAGVVNADGRWIAGCMPNAEWLEREMDFESPIVAEALRDMIPWHLESKMDRAGSAGTGGKE